MFFFDVKYVVKKAVTIIFFPFIVLQISDFYSVYRQLCINGHLSRREDKKADLLFAASKNMINGRTPLRGHSILDFEFLVFRFYCNFLPILDTKFYYKIV